MILIIFVYFVHAPIILHQLTFWHRESYLLFLIFFIFFSWVNCCYFFKLKHDVHIVSMQFSSSFSFLSFSAKLLSSFFLLIQRYDNSLFNYLFFSVYIIFSTFWFESRGKSSIPSSSSSKFKTPLYNRSPFSSIYFSKLSSPNL